MQVTRLHLPGVGWSRASIPSTPEHFCPHLRRPATQTLPASLPFHLAFGSVNLSRPGTGSLGTPLGFVHHLCHETTKWNSWSRVQSRVDRADCPGFLPPREEREGCAFPSAETRHSFCTLAKALGLSLDLCLYFSFPCSIFMRLLSVGTGGSLTLVPSPELFFICSAQL